MALWQWSKVANNNQTADPTINYSEGEAPSSLNDAGRAVMARVAEWRDDISGSVLTTGTSSAYIFTSNEGLPQPPTTGQMIAFTPHVTNAAGATLQGDSGNAYPLQTTSSSGSGVAVGAGVLVQGTPYEVMFNGTAWILGGNYGNPLNIPIGGMLLYIGTTLPSSNYAFPVGQSLSTSTYSYLFNTVLGGAYPYGGSGGSFNLPDMRNLAPFGLDAMGGSSARGLITANWNGAVLGGGMGTIGGPAGGGLEAHTLTQQHLPNIPVTFSGTPNQPLTYPGTTIPANVTGNLLQMNGTAALIGGNQQPQSGSGFSSPTTSGYSGTPWALQSPTLTPSGAVVFPNVGQANGTSYLGSGNSHPTMPPGISLPFLVRII